MSQWALSHDVPFVSDITPCSKIDKPLGLMCLAQGHNTVTPVRLEPVAPRSRVKYFTTEPLRSLFLKEYEHFIIRSQSDARTDRQRENSIPPTNKV